MNWETSNSQIRQSIGIQFFADEPMESMETESDSFEAESDGFEEGFFDDGEYQPAEEETPEPEGMTEDPTEDGAEAEAPEQAEEAATEAPEPTVPLVFNGQQMSLPRGAVEALSGALGGDVVTLLQKGMNYENRGSREIGILDRYAQASGYDNRAAYLDAMEQSLGQHQIDAELARLMDQYPEVPEDALRPIADRVVSDRNTTDKAQREQAAAEQGRTEAMKKGEEMTRPWTEFLRIHPEVDAKTLEKGFFDLVNTGLPPVAAYERMEAQKARAEAEQYKEQLKATHKNTQNRKAAVGTLSSETLESDPFWSGFGEI